MPIQLKDLTNGSTKREVGTQPVWEGTAIFDVLMKAVNENINIQFEQNRITGSDYATVYLGAITACIQEATSLLIQKAITDKEIEVKQAQILQIQASTLNTQEDTKLKTAQAVAFPLQSAKEIELLGVRIATEQEETKLKKEDIKLKVEEIKLKQEDTKLKIEETNLKAAQADAFPLQSAKEIALTSVRIETEQEEIKLKKEGIKLAIEDTKLKAAQAVAFPLQAAKDLDLTIARIAIEKEEVKLKVEDTKLKAAQAVAFPLQSDKELKQKQAQIDVANEEKRLKEAQADAYPLQAEKDALVKQANVDLLERQKEGFDDNKHQKLFEAQMNAWALMFSSGLLTTKPKIISDDSASTLYNTLKP